MFHINVSENILQSFTPAPYISFSHYKGTHIFRDSQISDDLLYLIHIITLFG